MVATHPLWRPYELASDEEIVAARVNAPQRGVPISAGRRRTRAWREV